MFEWDPFRKLIKRLLDELERMRKELELEEEKYTNKTEDYNDLKDYGIYFYGYSVTIGPDGKPIIREFGNIGSGMREFYEAIESIMRGETVNEESRIEHRVHNKLWEPLIEVIEDDDNITIVAEAPGASKENIIIKLSSNRRSLYIHIKGLYRKEIKLPSPVDPKSAKVKYKHNVLRITFSKAK